MPTIKIGVISDTHGLLRSQAREILQDCQQIIHAGDLDNAAILEKLQAIAPTTAVRGNMDFASWANRLKQIERLQIDKWSFVVVHNIEDLPEVHNTDIVIFGHSHKFYQEKRNDTLFLNPGSAGPRRFTLPITMAVLKLGTDIEVEQITLKSKP